jgi:hypothetical protein
VSSSSQNNELVPHNSIHGTLLKMWGQTKTKFSKGELTITPDEHSQNVVQNKNLHGSLYSHLHVKPTNTLFCME